MAWRMTSDLTPIDRVAATVTSRSLSQEPRFSAKNWFIKKPPSVPYTGESEHDLFGKMFGKLVVVAYAGKHPTKRVGTWVCRCVCGAYAIVRKDHLRKYGSDSGCSRCNYVAKMRTSGAPGDASLRLKWQRRIVEVFFPKTGSFPREAYVADGSPWRIQKWEHRSGKPPFWILVEVETGRIVNGVKFKSRHEAQAKVEDVIIRGAATLSAPLLNGAA